MKVKDVFYCGYVAIVGRPNVGKSTLSNLLLGEKLSIVTPKPQTTRHRILGILDGENYQIIFLDTPGLIAEPKYKLHELMNKTLRLALQDADLVILMIEPQPELQEELRLLDIKKNTILAINKIDLIQKDLLLPIIDSIQKTYNFKEIIPISALKADGLDQLFNAILKYLPLQPPYFPKDILTNQPERFFVGEIIREKIFEKYSQEIPYATTVLIEEFKEREGRKTYIRAIIYVERDSQRLILIGKKGEMLKKIGKSARQKIESFLGQEVFLELWVKTKKKWKDDIKALRELGY